MGRLLVKRQWFQIASDPWSAHFLLPTSESPTVCGIEVGTMIVDLAPESMERCRSCQKTIDENPRLRDDEKPQSYRKELRCAVCGSLCDGTVHADGEPICWNCGLERYRKAALS